jgi:hypothetical protein
MLFWKRQNPVTQRYTISIIQDPFKNYRPHLETKEKERRRRRRRKKKEEEEEEITKRKTVHILGFGS